MLQQATEEKLHHYTLYVPRETGNNAYAKFGRQTEYKGIFQSGLLLKRLPFDWL